MTEILFYHLQNRTLEQVLPMLLEKSRERGWRVIVQASSEERVDALDAHLWTYRDDSFLPHATWRASDAAQQPILLVHDEGNANAAAVRFLVDNAQMPADASAYERLVLIFDGDDEDALTQARSAWNESRARGLAATYWQADEQGRWVQRQ